MNLLSFLQPKKVSTKYPRLVEIPPEEIAKVLDLKFEADSIRVLPGGYNAHIIMIQTKVGSPDMVTKLYGDKKKPLTEQEARFLASQLVHYKLLLRDWEIPIPEMTDIVIVENKETGCFWVAESEHYVGNDQIEIVRSAPLERVEWVVGKMLEVGLPFFTTQEQLPIGLDPLPGNFCNKPGDDRFVFVDCMPSRFFENGRAYVEWPMPKTDHGYRIGLWKHFEADGLLTLFLTQLCRYRPELRQHFKEKIVRFLEEHDAIDVRDKIVNLPGWNVGDVTLDRAALTQLVQHNIYHARNLFCELAYLNQVGSKSVDQFFTLSHFEDEIEPSRVDLIVTALESFNRQ